MSKTKKKREAPVQAPDELLYWLWLAKTLGPGSAYAGRVIEKFEDAKGAWIVRKTGEFRETAGEAAFARANRLENAPETFRAFTRKCAEKHIQILPYGDPDYPKALCCIPDRPLVLYCTGNPQWLNDQLTVGLIGSRKPTAYGLDVAADMGEALAKSGVVIASGLADGLDSVGHNTAVKNSAPTVGVLGVPIDSTYPAANRELRRKIEANGCIISEYAPGSKSIGPNGFLQRNRLIAALSAAVLVVEAQEKSGTMSTVECAEKYGKKVYAVPGSIYSPNSVGTNALIGEGRAAAVYSPANLLSRLGRKMQTAETETAKAKTEPPLNDTERKIMERMGPKPIGLEELRVLTELPTSVLLRTLMNLELTKRIYRQPGQRYVLR